MNHAGCNRASEGSRTLNPRITNAVLCRLKLRWQVFYCQALTTKISAAFVGETTTVTTTAYTRCRLQRADMGSNLANY